MNTLNAIGAYGRDYETAKAAEADWKAGKDFKIIAGPYFSIRDTKLMLEEGYSTIVIHNRTCLPIYTIQLTN